MITLVTGLWDIGRGNLSEGWSRSFDHYLNKFEQLLQIDSVLDWKSIEEAYKSILMQDSELTDVDIRISLKPATEQKVAKITAKLY